MKHCGRTRHGLLFVLVGLGLVLGLRAVTWAQGETSSSAASAAALGAAPGSTTAAPPNLAAAYYHFMVARLFEGRAELAGSGKMASQALQQYRLAIDADPQSSYLPVQMAGLLFRTGRTGDAIRLARSVTREHPDSVAAHQLLGEIYARLLGDGADSHAGDMAGLAAQQFQALTRLQPNNAEFHLTLGRLYTVEGDTAKAEREFQTVRHLAGDTAAAAADLVRLYADHGEMAKAQSVFASVPADQRTGEMYAALASAYHDRHQFTAAAQAYQRAVAEDSGNLAYRQGLASNLYHSGQLQAARQQYQWLTQAEPQSGRYWLRLAEIDQNSGQLAKVRQDLAASQRADPDDPAVAFFQSQFEESQGHFVRAAQALRTVLQGTSAAGGHYSPRVAHERGLFWEKLGTLERQAGHAREAIAAFTHMQRFGRRNRIRGYLQISSTYGHIHQYAQALSTARAGWSAFPQDRALAVSYALLLAGNGQDKPAVAVLQPFLKSPVHRRSAFLALAEVRERGKHWGAAQHALRQAAALSSSNAEQAMVQFMRGDLASQRHRYRSAERYLQAALKLDPNNALALNDLAYLWADHGVHLHQALRDIQQAVAADPENGPYLDTLGWVYFKQRQLPEAIRQLQKAVRLEPHDPTIAGHLAAAYQAAGQLPPAAAAWRRALENWSSSAPADYDSHAVARDRKQLAQVQKVLAHHARD